MPKAGSPMSPSSAASMTGTWSGAASDSTGSMMGTGMMASSTWTITQSGNVFSGSMQLPGQMGRQITLTGVMNGHTGTYTITMPAGSMMNGLCSATATGAFDMDDLMTEFHGTYAGMNTCTGPFDHGDLFMHR